MCSRAPRRPSTSSERRRRPTGAGTSPARCGTASRCGRPRPGWGSCSGGSRAHPREAPPPRPCGRARWPASPARGRALQSLVRPIAGRTRPPGALRAARRSASAARREEGDKVARELAVAVGKVVSGGRGEVVHVLRPAATMRLGVGDCRQTVGLERLQVAQRPLLETSRCEATSPRVACPRVLRKARMLSRRESTK